MLINFLVRALQSTECLILDLFCQLKYEKKNTQNYCPVCRSNSNSKISRSQMWLIDQLYIKLSLPPSEIRSTFSY